jgi:hypothetical protein
VSTARAAADPGRGDGARRRAAGARRPRPRRGAAAPAGPRRLIRPSLHAHPPGTAGPVCLSTPRSGFRAHRYELALPLPGGLAPRYSLGAGAEVRARLLRGCRGAGKGTEKCGLRRLGSVLTSWS